MARDEYSVELWRHPAPKETPMWAFKEAVNRKYGLELKTYNDLYQWSIDDIASFWAEVWDFTGITASRQYDKVIDPNAPMFPRSDFFQGSLLNFAENLLFPRNRPPKASSKAIIEATELGHTSITWSQLRERVRQCAASMKSLGIQPNDRIAGFVGNHANAVVAMLAATSMGAIWTAVSPDTGVAATLDRLVQIEPVLLFVDTETRYNGKIHGCWEKVKEIVGGLEGLSGVVVFGSEGGEGGGADVGELSLKNGRAWRYGDFVKSAVDPSLPLTFTQLSPSHPVYILYSSGTTGKPKCIVHSALGTLMQHKKEHQLHCSMLPGDRLFYFTTVTWMMWHWLVSALASGVTLILYDGSPFAPHGLLSMPLLIQNLRITHFGTSAKYLSVLEQKATFPFNSSDPSLPLVNLSSLRAIYSTGSPLAPSTFQYVYKAFGREINLGSITGGTDIISLFGAPNPLSPVWMGEIQCVGLGMAVRAFGPGGEDVTERGEGDLVCVKPFPCQPVGFYGPDGDAKYRSSYFEQFPGVWHHGDFVRFVTHSSSSSSSSPSSTPGPENDPESPNWDGVSNTPGLIMLGRSDGILKPSGVRFGSAEIYNVLLKHFGKEVEDALCIGRRRQGVDDDETVVLFLKMCGGEKLTEELKERVKGEVRKELSARHVPGIIEECAEIPVTGNGKKIEVAVKQILCGMNVKTSASVANAECLDWYREWARTH